LKKQLVTAALPYANGPLHIGHIAGCYLPADIYVRYQKIRGNDTIFVCGSDEHGVPISLRAKAENKSPQEVVDHYHLMMKEAFEGMDIRFDVYSRTTSKIHYDTAQEIFKTIYDKGGFREIVTAQLYDAKAGKFLADRYIIGTCNNCGFEKAYGDQCESCGKTLSPEELINPISALSGEKPVKKETTNWFLPLDELQEKLNAYVNSHISDWKINVYGQCKSWLNEGLKPRAMTRDLDWGVPLPIAETKGKVMYVWFDAPIGYISATKEFLPDTWQEYWKNPSSELIHFIGKDNIVFHCLIFPAMLMQEGSYNLPTMVPANEFLNLEGQKISTSRNYAVWVHEYLAAFNNRSDEMRFVLCSIAPETKDADFSWSDFQARVNNELVAIFGNFVNRVSVLMHKYFDGIVPESEADADEETLMWQNIENHCQQIDENITNYKFREALSHWVSLSRIGNKYLADSEPWKTIKTDLPKTKQILNNAVNLIALIADYGSIFVPKAADKIKLCLQLSAFNCVYNRNLILDFTKLTPIPLLFPVILDDEIEIQIKLLHKEELIPTITQKSMINYEDFQKLQLVTATIVSATKVENADKLLKITLRLSENDERVVLSGIADHYNPVQIIGKQVTYLMNLASRKIRGIESHGMILLAENDGKLVFITPENKIEDGSEIA